MVIGKKKLRIRDTSDIKISLSISFLRVQTNSFLFLRRQIFQFPDALRVSSVYCAQVALIVPRLSSCRKDRTNFFFFFSWTDLVIVVHLLNEPFDRGWCSLAFRAVIFFHEIPWISSVRVRFSEHRRRWLAPFCLLPPLESLNERIQSQWSSCYFYQEIMN